MTPEQRIKRHILLAAIEQNDDLNWDGELDASNVDEAWNVVLVDNDAHWDYENDFRSDGEDTGLLSRFNRNYEAKEKACQLVDGTWVGWTYWFGGGKYGEPGSIEWMNKAYDVDVVEEVKTVTVRKFTKKDA